MTTLVQRREAQRVRQIERAREYRQRSDMYEALNAFEFNNGGIIYDPDDMPEDDPSDELFTATYVKDEKKSEWADRVLKAAKERTELTDIQSSIYTDIPAMPHRTELEEILDDVKYNSRMQDLLADSRVRDFKKKSQKEVLLMTDQEERAFKMRLAEAARKTITLPIETLPQITAQRRRPPPRVDQKHKKPAVPSGFSTMDPFLIIPKDLEKEQSTGCIQTQPFRLGTDYKLDPDAANHRIGVGSRVLRKFKRHEQEYNEKVQYDTLAEINAMRQRTREAYEQSRTQIMTQRTKAPKVSQNTAGCIEPRDILRLDLSVEKLNKQGSLIRGYDSLFNSNGRSK